MTHLVATVGSNPLPILDYCLRSTDPEDVSRITLFASDASLLRAHRVASVLAGVAGQAKVSVFSVNGFEFRPTVECMAGVAGECQQTNCVPVVLYSGGTQLMSVALTQAFGNSVLLESPFGGGHPIDRCGQAGMVGGPRRSLEPADVAICHDILYLTHGDGPDDYEMRCQGLLNAGTALLEHVVSVRPSSWVFNEKFVLSEPPMQKDFEVDAVFVIGWTAFVGEFKSEYFIRTGERTRDRKGYIPYLRARARQLGGLHAKAFIVFGDENRLAGSRHPDFPDVAVFSGVDLVDYANGGPESEFWRWVTNSLPRA